MSRPFELEPADLLRQADRVLRAMQPAFSVHFAAWGYSYRARFDYPGRVSVFDRNTGELIARSRPGHPSKLAALPRVRNAGRR
ncbi:MAG: hypothetical protein WA210_00515 [Burkholderiaceae bacterium]